MVWCALLAHGFNHNAEILFMSVALLFFIKYIKYKLNIYILLNVNGEIEK